MLTENSPAKIDISSPVFAKNNHGPDEFPRRLRFPPAIACSPRLTLRAWKLQFELWTLEDSQLASSLKEKIFPVSQKIHADNWPAMGLEVDTWKTAQLFFKNGTFALRLETQMASGTKVYSLCETWETYLKATRLIPFVRQGVTIESVSRLLIDQL
jgi:hypothetical protein